MYPENSAFPVYCVDCWRSDKWEGTTHGVDFDLKEPFFAQFKGLLSRVPRMNLFQMNCLNSQYCNYARDTKNIYLSYSTVESEDIFYSKNTDRHSYRLFDCYDSIANQNCYEIIKGDQNYNCRFGYLIYNCIDSDFLFDCSGCRNCFMSSNLRNKEYWFRSQPCTKEEYRKKIDDFVLGSRRNLHTLRTEFREVIRTSLHKYGDLMNCVNSSGNNLVNCKNSKMSFTGIEMENAKYMFRTLPLKDSMDGSYVGVALERCYESVSGGIPNSMDIKFCANGLSSLSNVQYSDFCLSSSNLFGCAGLKSKNYYILNKQYSKEEYTRLLPRIINQMMTLPYEDSFGRSYKYGEFFPSELSPFAYNETLAQEYFPQSKEVVLEKGYSWKDEPRKTYDSTRLGNNLPDNIEQVENSVLEDVIKCEHNASDCNHQCTTAFKIIPEELEFYRRMKIALPLLCPNCRHYERLALRNPLKLWHCQCMCGHSDMGNAAKNTGKYKNTAEHFHGISPCPNEFETSYPPDSPAVVYCEQCYNGEIA